MEEEFGESPLKTLSITGTEMALFKVDCSGQNLHNMTIPDEVLSQIRVLDFSQNHLRDLDFLEKCPNLIEIDGSGNKIGSGLNHIENLLFLSVLNLSSNVFENLSKFPPCETLTSLDLSNNVLKKVDDLPLLPRLLNLNISHNSIEDLHLKELPSLQTLDISGNQIEKLTLPSLPSLRQLNASHNSISEISEFTEDQLPILWSCDLKFNSLQTPDTLKALSKLPLLYELQVSSNPLVQDDGSHVSFILVILPCLTNLDGKPVNAKDKVKAELSVGKGKHIEEEEQQENQPE